MDKVLVTGATGFIGSAVIKALFEYEVEIHVMSTKTNNIRGDEYFHHCNIMDYDEVNTLITETKPKYLIHLAWNVEHSTYLNSEENLLWVGASLNLIKSFIENGGRRVFTSGTCFEYEFGEKPLKEYKSALKPLTLYAESKINLYYLIKRYCKETKASLVWGRLFYLYGENERITRVIPYAITELLKGNQVTCKNATAIRDYFYVNDAGRAIARTLFSSVEGEINIASGKPIQMGEIFKIIGQVCKAEDKVVLLDDPVVPQSIVADIDILCNKVGFREYTDLSTGLEQTVNWWRNSL